MGQHLVVPGEIAHRQQLDAGVLLHLPVRRAQFATDGAQAGFVEFAFPEGFLRLLQFTVAADAGEAEGMGQCHGGNLQYEVDGAHCRQPGRYETNSIYSRCNQVLLMLDTPPCSNFAT
ncbi:hypothetical protein D9M71_706960 [compost metagenome]